MDAVEYIKSGSRESPYKTRQSIFLEQWPNAKINNDGVLDIKPCTIEKSIVCCRACTECYQNFWMQEIE